MKQQEFAEIYVPDSEKKYPLIGIYFYFVKNLIRSKTLIWQLYKRDFLAGYRKSFLSFFWIFLAPLVSIISWVLLNYAGILKPGDVGISYPVYVLIGTSIYGFGIALYNSVSGTLSAGAGFINQVKYPHEVLFLKQILIPLTNFSISICFNIIIAIIFGGIKIDFELLLLPLILMPLILFASSIGLIMSMITIVLIDTGNITSSILGMFIYFSPILYKGDTVPPVLRKVIEVNPLTYLVCNARDWILYGRLYSIEGYVASWFWSGILMLLALRLFIISEKKLIEKMLPS